MTPQLERFECDILICWGKMYFNAYDDSIIRGQITIRFIRQSRGEELEHIDKCDPQQSYRLNSFALWKPVESKALGRIWSCRDDSFLWQHVMCRNNKWISNGIDTPAGLVTKMLLRFSTKVIGSTVQERKWSCRADSFWSLPQYSFNKRVQSLK